MLCSEVIERLRSEAPVPVMARATLEKILSDARVNEIFSESAISQKDGELLFSTVVDLMLATVTRVQPSLHAAYQSRAEQIEVSVRSIYNKVKGVESQVTRHLVTETSSDMLEVLQQMRATRDPLFPGYRTKIIDGNHLARTERRLGALRDANVAPRPGHTLVVLDQESDLVIDAFPNVDGFSQERSQLPAVLATVEAGDIWIADRNFCTTEFVSVIADRGAGFVIRQHSKTLRHELVGERKWVAETATGQVYEQCIHIERSNGEVWVARRVTIELNQTTRNGDSVVHVVTNLPENIQADAIASGYLKRWTIETMFCQLEATLRNEVNTLAFPQAALFGFGLALVAYNIMNLIQGALRASHGHEKVQEEVSVYYIADEIQGTWRGLDLLIDKQSWKEKFGAMSNTQLARFLLLAAKSVNLKRFQKHKRKPKKPLKQMNKKCRVTVSTYRELAAEERN